MKNISLSPMESKALKCLTKKIEDPKTMAELVVACYDYEPPLSAHTTVAGAIRNLSKKLNLMEHEYEVVRTTPLGRTKGQYIARKRT